ncbi:hypothetical protein Y032_0405g873 [Ancylostoma ceylanicum]|uniref:Uncharacterized protein n=1 Tax=Ancylostoma ceylanicum TaxID=53326 RepID=A0A016X2P9_9BILA|nr:hypothetical protein Y032_0405g873 [Ancylostoma ceylanicum]
MYVAKACSHFKNNTVRTGRPSVRHRSFPTDDREIRNSRSSTPLVYTLASGFETFHVCHWSRDFISVQDWRTTYEVKHCL